MTLIRDDIGRRQSVLFRMGHAFYFCEIPSSVFSANLPHTITGDDQQKEEFSAISFLDKSDINSLTPKKWRLGENSNRNLDS